MPSAAATNNNNESTNWMAPHLQKIKAKIEEHPSLDHHLTILEGHLRISKAAIALIFGGLLALALASGVASQLICTAVGCLYPAYCSIKALGNRKLLMEEKFLTILQYSQLKQTFLKVVIILVLANFKRGKPIQVD